MVNPESSTSQPANMTLKKYGSLALRSEPAVLRPKLEWPTEFVLFRSRKLYDPVLEKQRALEALELLKQQYGRQSPKS